MTDTSTDADTAHYVGRAAAHACWTIHDGTPLAPFVMYDDGDGVTRLERNDEDELADVLASTREWFASYPDDVARGVLVYARDRSVVLEARSFEHVQARDLVIELPFEHRGKRFTVLRPKLVTAPAGVEPNAILEAFFAGIAEHPWGAEMWSSHYVG